MPREITGCRCKPLNLFCFLMLVFCSLAVGNTKVFALGQSSNIPTLSTIPVPSNAKISVVGDSINQNGKQISIATYQSNLSLVETVAFYQRTWANLSDNAIPAVNIVRNDQWLMISRLQAGRNIVVQLDISDGQKSHGYVSIMNIESAATISTSNRFPGFELLSQTRSIDSSENSLMSVYSSASSVEIAARQCLDVLRRHDWVLVSDRGYKQSKVYLLNRPGANLEIVVSQDRAGKSVLVLNEVSHGE